MPVYLWEGSVSATSPEKKERPTHVEEDEGYTAMVEMHDPKYDDLEPHDPGVLRYCI